MKITAVVYCLVGLTIGLVIGFLASNAFSRNASLPRNEQQSIALTANASTQSSSNDEFLTRNEIDAAFASIENKKDDVVFQKNLGIALARYAQIQQNADFLPQLINLLERVNLLSKEKDFDVLITLGDVYFLNARAKNDSAFEQKARDAYQKATRLKPEKVEAKTALANTFLYGQTPQNAVAVGYLNDVLKQSPDDEIARQLLITALIGDKNFDAAEKQLSELKNINANNQSIPDFEAQLKQKKLE